MESVVHRITLNGEEVQTAGAPEISYEAVCNMAHINPSHNPSITYHTTRKGDEQRHGILSPGRVVRIEDGMVFNAAVTGNG